MRAYAKEHVGLTRAVFELYRGVFSCFVVMQASALSVGQRLLFIAETKEQCNKKGGSHYDPKQQFMEKNLFYTSCQNTASGGNYQIRTNHYAFTAVPVNKSTCKRA